jgi:hypothetical protein
MRNTAKITYYADSEVWVDQNARYIQAPMIGDVVDLDASDPEFKEALKKLGLTITVFGLVKGLK